ncbi:glycoside hydrolase [Serendipita vermifera]|nr:glycoside hydrolase [Serendipita vermifera]
MKSLSLVLVTTLLGLKKVNAAVGQWGQCGGLYHQGETTCVAGCVCVYFNDWYSQCLAGTTTTTSTTRTSTSTTTSTTTTSTLSPLHDLAKAAGKQYFGVAVGYNQYNDASYKVNLDNTRLFGQVTPENEMKWDATEPSRDSFSYGNADTIVNWAVANGKEVRGHTLGLFWHSQLPSWVTNGNFNNATLVSIMQNHITKLVTHWSGKVKTWDVINEVFNEDGTWRSSVFYNTIGEYFVDIAFRTAAAADSNVGLAANEYNLDYGQAKTTAYVNLANRLKSRGVKITQIGSQSHLIVGSVPSLSSLTSTFTSITATGVDLAVTELDIRMTLPVTDALLAQQKKDYNTVVLACIKTPRCVGVTIWTYSDKYSWIPDVFSGEGAALPWDDRLQIKPAFYGIADALQGVDDTASTTFIPTSTKTSSSTSTTTSSTTTTTTTTTTSSTSSTATPNPTNLNDLAKAAGKQYFGVAVGTNLSNATYKVNLDNIHLFGQVTPENEMKWDATEPSRNSFSFSRGDTIVNWALSGGKEIRGHTLVWHSQLPSWVTNGNFNNATLVSIMQNHVTKLVTYWSGKVKTWDVINEVFNEDGTWRSSVLYNTIGEYFVDIAFRTAAAADPNVGLAANEYNLDYGQAKTTAYINLVNRLKARGVKINQIGSQSHLTVGGVPSVSALTSTFTSITNTGVDLAVTELDIRMTLPVTSARLAQQKRDYNTVVLACLRTPRCVGITIWAYADSHSWVPGTFPGEGAALPWDDQLKPKPAFYGISEGFQGITSS